jgi:4'-phosphopantetheinyl transferase
MHKASVFFLDTVGLSYEKIRNDYFCLIESSRRSRIDKCVNPHSREMILYTGAFLVKVLGRYGVSTADIMAGSNGKPCIKDRDDLFFNLSHSGRYVAVAVADSEIGIDIQKPVKARDKLIERIASDRERTEYKVLTDERFNLFWALKESYSKLTGEGIGTDFTKFELCFDGKGSCADTALIKASGQTLAYSRIIYPDADHPAAVTMYHEFEFQAEPEFMVL